MVVALAFGLAAGLGACGSSGADSDGGPEALATSDFAPLYSPPAGARRGGELRVLASGDVDSLDPGTAQNQFSFMVLFATQRTLLTGSSDQSASLRPDLATALPEVDRRRGTIEVEIRPDVRFSPPVSRNVIAADVEYAIERSLLPGISNGLTEAFLSDLVGFDAARRQARRDNRAAPDISGVEALSPTVLRLSFRGGTVPPLAIDALSLPLTAPVPAGYARRFDANVPSTYPRHLLATGPYMVENDERGQVTGYQPGKKIELVRNPEWRADTDFRPAFLDRITIESGFVNTAAAARRIVSGSAMVNGDFAPDPGVLQEVAENHPEQLTMVPAGATLYASLNTTIPPLDDADVRRAIVAATDRTALRLARGGDFTGPIATHFIPPGMPGFREAGGIRGPDLDFLASPEGDPDVAAAYMRRAGYPSGRYDGDASLTMVTDNTGIGRRTGEIVRQAMAGLGLEVTARSVTQDSMYSKFCSVPRARVAVCPNVGWVKQFDDAQTMLDLPFNGLRIQPVNNSNWPQLNVPRINAAIERAAQITEPGQRARAWAGVDRRITAQAPAIPILWSSIPSIASPDVSNVITSSTASTALPMVSLTDPEG